MEQSSSFLEEGRERVSRKEMDNVTERHFIRCP